MDSSRRSLMKKECLAGFTTFVTMSYCIIVNPSILSAEGTGMPFQGVLTGTVMLAFAMTLLMSLYAKLPYAIAPGMGLNAFFAFSLILGEGIPWQEALGLVFWSGILFIIISVTPIRSTIAKAIPEHLRTAIAVGIGLFIAFIGFKNALLIVADPATFVQAGSITPQNLLCLAGLVVIVVLFRRNNPFTFLVSILSITIVAIICGYVSLPEKWLALPDFSSVFFKLDFTNGLRIIYLPIIISIVFTCFFDSTATFLALSQTSNMLDEHQQPKNLKQGLIADACSCVAAGLFGTSPGTVYLESAAGIQVGGRTYLTSLVCAFCFLPCLFISPIAGIIPAYATAPVLIFVGILMFKNIFNINFKCWEEFVPSFFIIILIPLCFSITQGILWGFILHSILFLLAGRKNEIHPTMWILSLLCAGLILIDNIK